MDQIQKCTATWGGQDYELGDVIKHVNFEREWEVQGADAAGHPVVKALDGDSLLVLAGPSHRYWEVVKARRIRTAEGARKYGKPIGSTIGGGGAPKMDRSLASGAGKGEAPEAARLKDERRQRAIDRDRKADAEGDKRTKEREGDADTKFKSDVGFLVKGTPQQQTAAKSEAATMLDKPAPNMGGGSYKRSVELAFGANNKTQFKTPEGRFQVVSGGVTYQKFGDDGRPNVTVDVSDLFDLKRGSNKQPHIPYD